MGIPRYVRHDSDFLLPLLEHSPIWPCTQRNTGAGVRSWYASPHVYRNTTPAFAWLQARYKTLHANNKRSLLYKVKVDEVVCEDSYAAKNGVMGL